MTRLSKPIRREVDVHGPNRPIIIELDPDTKRIGFHEKGRRKTFWLPIATAFAMAIRTGGGEKSEKVNCRDKENAQDGAGRLAPDGAGTEKK